MKIIPILVGGLGNRLYQIANAIRLKKIYNSDLEFYRIDATEADVKKFRHLVHRIGDFDDFGGHTISPLVNLPTTINDIFPKLNFSQEKIRIDSLLFNKNLFFEQNIHLMSDAKDAVVMGYYFSHSYIKNEIEDVRDLFNPVIEKYVNEKYPELDSRRIMGIHLRLGINSDNTPAINVPIEFYNKVIAREYHNIDSIFVVSDNISKAKNFATNLNYGDKSLYYVENEPMYVDMWVLSKCKVLLIAPSTLSAWSAHLNKNKNIYAPKIWPQHHWTQDIPTEWKLY